MLLLVNNYLLFFCVCSGAVVVENNPPSVLITGSRRSHPDTARYFGSVLYAGIAASGCDVLSAVLICLLRVLMGEAGRRI